MAMASASLSLPLRLSSLPPPCSIKVAHPSSASSSASCRFHPLKLSPRSRPVVAFAAPKAAVAKGDDLTEKVEQSIMEAQKICAGHEETGECAAAWDEVEELSATISHKRHQGKAAQQDPLEKFCKDNPDSDECRMYED
ncbi:hypothetical protein O6H91_15G056800 [Diphasiastrum complanatum]|uniref:Uncharacterized protein n=2 Tax=Diphasiastrum complanatum TaxID=34168 RepID=A0ACC2BIM1_DIPCM|nr:hypothetical protein O6H91_15G056800 [Diphasiastrum complanatum]KAJ7529551.1 hypothetical protein O6H91_15G056800 [Diphasiastrum complanatum]